MRHLAFLLFTTCSASAWSVGVAAQDVAARGTEVVHFEYSGGAADPGLWWARRRDEVTVQFTNWTRVSAPSRPEGITGSTLGKMEALARPFFIGNTIENLRGLDPTFGTRTLTLIDGRRQPVQPRPATPRPDSASIADALTTLVPQNISTYMPQIIALRTESPPPVPVELPDDLWLLKKDGTVIRPLRKSPVAEDQKYCAEGQCEQGYVYGFPPSAATEAVAVAFNSRGTVATRKLDSLAGLQQ